MIHAFYSLGSLAGPVYATMVQKSGQHWNTSFVNLGILCTVITVVFLAIIAPVKVETRKGDGGSTIREAVKLLGNRKLQLLAILCCAYMGHQSLICLWISTYAQSGLGLSADIGSNFPDSFLGRRWFWGVFRSRPSIKGWITADGFSIPV